MRVAILNMVPKGSTGKIMLQTAQVARKQGWEAKTYCTQPFSLAGKTTPISAPDHYYWGSFYENMFHYCVGSTLGRNGCYSVFGTRKLVKELKKFQPDVLHLHNLHSHCIHFPTLLSYIKKHNISTIWTLHDCWTFTGQCAHFDMFGCDKWKTGCHHCQQPISYPRTRIDNSKHMYHLKKKWFTGVKNMTLATPSQWLANLTRESFLQEYPVRVIPNGIDLSVFKPIASDFRKRYNCEDKTLLLGVAFGWGSRKGLDVFLELAKRLPDSYCIVLVGTNDRVDAMLPENIISIHRTDNQTELAKIYSAADVFVNCTREDTFPTVNMEALACGTPVVTFRTGGSPEMLDSTCGSVVEKNDVDALEQEILRICTQKPFTPESCQKRAESFEMYDRFGQYVKLYEEVANK